MTVRVLIVDDQEPFRAVAREVVEAAGDFEVVGEAASGEESVDLAQALRPDLVLMDVNLPGMDGTDRLTPISGMATHRVRIADAAGLDEELVGWLREAYERA